MCSICHEYDNVSKEIESMATPCNHTFCKDCLCHWDNLILSSRCSVTSPMCRGEIGQDCVNKLYKIDWDFLSKHPKPHPPINWVFLSKHPKPHPPSIV